MIPKRFVYYWGGDKPMPDRFKKFMRENQLLHPGWEFKTGNFPDKPFAAQEFPPSIELGDAKRLAANESEKSDIFRWHYLFQKGGWYLDTDMQILQPLDHLCGQSGVMGFMRMPGVAPGTASDCGYALMPSLVGFEPHHPFVGAVIDGMAERMREFAGKDSGQKLGSWPQVVWESWSGKPFALMAPHTFYPWSAVENAGKSELSTEEIKRRYPNSLACHHYEGSWTK